MKKRKITLLFTIYFTVILLVVCVESAMSANITGVVIDSSSGAPINGVKVKCVSPACSTLTNAKGSFSLTLPALVGILPSVSRTIKYDPSRNIFFSDGEVLCNVCDLRGRIRTKAEKISPGSYFAKWQISGVSGVFKFLNIPGECKSFVIGSQTISLAKALAGGYPVNFTAPNYNSVSLSVLAGQNVSVVLSPINVKSDSAKLNLNIKLDSAGTASIKAIFVDSLPN